MKCCVITSFNAAYSDVYEISMPLMKMYVDRHGYGLEVGLYKEDPNDLLTWGDRGKWALFESWYDKYDAIMWLDIDVLVMNHDITIEERASHPFIWSHDHNGPCSGFWIARCVPEVKMMASKIREEAVHGRNLIASAKTHPHRTFIQVEPYGRSDQDVMRELMTIPPYAHILKNCLSLKEAGHCFDFRALNAPRYLYPMGNYEPGDWLYTVPSLPLRRRIPLLAAKALEFYDALPELSDAVGYHRGIAAAYATAGESTNPYRGMRVHRRGSASLEPAAHA